jgi:hypothetical protein
MLEKIIIYLFIFESYLNIQRRETTKIKVRKCNLCKLNVSVYDCTALDTSIKKEKQICVCVFSIFMLNLLGKRIC